MIFSALKVLAVAAAVAAPTPDTARLTLLGGEIHRGVTVVSITDSLIRYRDSSGKTHESPVADMVGISLPAIPRTESDPGPSDVEVLLRGGDRIRGSLRPGAEETVSIGSPLLGPLSFRIDDVKELRFVEAWGEAVEKPPAQAGEDEDRLYYRNLDKLEGTFLKVEANKVVVYTRSGDTRSVYFANLLSIKVADAPEPKSGDRRLAVLNLGDGSKVTVSSLTSNGETLDAVTVRGKSVSVRLSDVRALYQKGGRFVYLSDLEPKEAKVVPWIGEVYAWDRPRTDLSVLDRPLSAGGETYLKGIGVISGTSLTFALEGGYKQFTSLIAVDDAAGPEGDVVFEILLDGEVRFASKTVRVASKPIRIPPIDLEGAKNLTLRVSYVDDFVKDFANWIEPMLIR